MWVCILDQLLHNQGPQTHHPQYNLCNITSLLHWFEKTLANNQRIMAVSLRWLSPSVFTNWCRRFFLASLAFIARLVAKCGCTLFRLHILKGQLAYVHAYLRMTLGTPELYVACCSEVFVVLPGLVGCMYFFWHASFSLPYAHACAHTHAHIQEWRDLAVLRGFSQYIQIFELKRHPVRYLLKKWGENPKWSAEALIAALEHIDRIDVVHFIRSRFIEKDEPPIMHE